MKRLDCFLYGLWLSLRHLSPVSGHEFIEVYNNRDLQVLRCELCGKESNGWKREEFL